VWLILYCRCNAPILSGATFFFLVWVPYTARVGCIYTYSIKNNQINTWSFFLNFQMFFQKSLNVPLFWYIQLFELNKQLFSSFIFFSFCKICQKSCVEGFQWIQTAKTTTIFFFSSYLHIELSISLHFQIVKIMPFLKKKENKRNLCACACCLICVPPRIQSSLIGTAVNCQLATKET
jgi:hypothetical protein